MLKEYGRMLGLALALCSLASFTGPGNASAQILAVGGHVSVNPDIEDDLTLGVGARAHLSLPLTGFTIQGTYDFYGPKCGTLECDLGEAGLNLLWSLPVPFLLNPYLGAGVAFQNWTGESAMGTDSDQGFNFLAGVVLQGPTFSRFQPFVEVKYQKWNDFEDQKVLSAGILLSLF